MASAFACLSVGNAHAAETPDAGAPADAPKGVATKDWTSIRAVYEAGRHAIVVAGDGTRIARNPGQQWRTRFDGRGFTVTPDAGAWTWGLELRSFGFDGAQAEPGLAANGARTRFATATHRQGELYYDWSPALREWFVNDARGLQQGWTLNERPARGKRGGSLRLELAVRGGLVPRISEDRDAVSFGAAGGGHLLNFAGLKAWDADGKTLAVHFERGGDARLRIAVDERDARYPITIDPIAQQAYLKASNTEAGDQFGIDVAVSGNTVVVGARDESSSATGINGNQASNGASRSGAAYIFVRSGTTWTQQAYVKASNARPNAIFGENLALSGDTLVVGSRTESSNATGVNGDQSDTSAAAAGAAYVFVRSGSTWRQQAYLKASNTDPQDQFGGAVAIAGDIVVIGAANEKSAATGVNGDQGNSLSGLAFGATYVFVRSGQSWTQQAYVKASNTGTARAFGNAVAVSGDTMAVGAVSETSSATGVNGSQASGGATNAGAAYVLTRSGTTWTQQAYVKASNTAAVDQFGYALALSGDTLVVTAVGEDSSATGINGDQTSNGASRSGAAYVFVRSGIAWTQQAYVKASNTGESDEFGESVALDGDTLVVGTFLEASNATGIGGNQNDNSASFAGAAYVFVRSSGSWTQQAYVKASNTNPFYFFGTSVAVSGNLIAVGAVGEASNATGVGGNQNDTSAASSGAAYMFDAPPGPVIFIPGISGSTLVNDPLGVADEVWVGFPLPSRRVLSLYAVDNPPPPDPNARNIDATDATRFVSNPLTGNPVLEIYRPLLSSLTAQGGFREYQVSGLPSRRTTAGCDMTQFNANPNLNPNLFVFAYDWRKSNIQTAAKLRDYVGCVRRLHPGSEVNLLTHSMGGLVARRYVLDNPADNHIDKMVTVVAPWLGAVKVLNVLESGDFIPWVAAGSDMKYIAPSLTAAAQLLASRGYFELGGAPMLVEDGYDADGDGRMFETYEYVDVMEFIDRRYVLPAPTLPGTTNLAFHSLVTPAGAQDDWRVDTTGIEYFHLYGVQAGNLTISQLVARNRIVCSPFQFFICRISDVFDLRFTVGDATVPARSAGRSTSFGNYNAPGARTFRFAVSDASQNALADHTEITHNPAVLSKVLELLAGAAVPPAALTSPPGEGSSSVMTAGLSVTDDELQSTVPSYYLTLDGGSPLVVGDAQGNSTAIMANDLRDTVPGVQTHVIGDGIEMVTLPIPVTAEYSITFLSNANPIALEVIKGVDNITPTDAVRYLDKSLPDGVLVRIQITAAGIGPLRYDSDGNGSFDTLVPPTVTLSGPPALDTTAPEVTASQHVQGATTQVTLTATDSASGVGAVRYSLDGTQFQLYTGTLAVNPATSPFVYAFADDNAGNRSGRIAFRVVTPTTVSIFQNSFE